MKKTYLTIGLIIIVVLAGAFYLHTKGVLHMSNANTQDLNADAYPLYTGATWGTGHTDTQEGLSGYFVTSSTSEATDNIASITAPFEQYYQDKLTAAGWTVDNALAAAGPGSSLTAYEKGKTYIVIGYTTKFDGGGVNEPVQCPCHVTLGIFSGAVAK